MEIQKIEKLEVHKNYKFSTTGKNPFIILNGVVIHSRLRDELDFLQLNDPSNPKIDNAGFESIATEFIDLFSYLAYSAEYTNETQKVLDLLLFLHHRYETTKSFSVPNNLFQIDINKYKLFETP